MKIPSMLPEPARLANFKSAGKEPLATLGWAAAFILISSAPALWAAPQSQTPPPPSKTQTQADNNSAPQTSRSAIRVLRQMVQVDIIAKDRNGKPIEDLKQ